MSMPFLVFSCTACEYQGSSTVNWGQFTYEAQSRWVPIRRALGWCSSCEDIAPIEILPSNDAVRQLEMDIEQKAKRVDSYKADAARSRSLLGKLLGSQPRLPPDIQELDFQRSYRENDLQKERDRLDLLRRRDCGPKCLLCGSENCIPLPGKITPSGTDRTPGPATPFGMNHPACSGALLVAHSGLRVSRRLNHRLYDCDGNLLREEESR